MPAAVAKLFVPGISPGAGVRGHGNRKLSLTVLKSDLLCQWELSDRPLRGQVGILKNSRVGPLGDSQ